MAILIETEVNVTECFLLRCLPDFKHLFLSVAPDAVQFALDGALFGNKRICCCNELR
jgi:hypothetical protein